MNGALSRTPLLRIARSSRTRLHLFAWTSLAVLGAILARQSGAPNSADQLMRGAFAYVFVPLLAYGIVSGAFGGTGLRPAIRGLVAMGASPARAAASSIAVAVAVCGLASGVLALAVCGLAHGSADPPLARDLPSSFGIAMLGGAAYAAYFAVGSAIGRGAMRGGFLVLDWILGASAGLGSVLTPRAHLASLLGGPPSFVLSRPASSVTLVILLLGWFALAVRLGRRPLRS